VTDAISLADRVRAYLLAEHHEYLAAVLARADELDGPDADALAASLDAAGLLDRAPAVLEGSVAAAGRSLPHDPVAAPPYVVVTTAGLVLRATLAGGRLVVTLVAFEYDRDAAEWVYAGTTPEEALEVEVR